MLKIRHLKRSQIDTFLWDKCISQSQNSRIYAYSWYLDCMTENWDALIIGEYETVMPLPWKSKYGLKYIYRPPLIQQLGVFSVNDSIDIFQLLQSIPYYFIKIDYFFCKINLNEKQNGLLQARKNLTLNLNQPYSQIEKNYKDTLKRNLKSSLNNGSTISKLDIESISLLIDFYKKAYGKFYTHFDETIFDRIKLLMRSAIEKGIGSIYATNLYNGEIGSLYFVLNDGNRIYYLLGAPNEEGKKNKSIPFLINEIIKENAGKPLIFDFEGSEIPSVASFYEKFNPDLEYYYQLSYFNLLGFKFQPYKNKKIMDLNSYLQTLYS